MQLKKNGNAIQAARKPAVPCPASTETRGAAGHRGPWTRRDLEEWPGDAAERVRVREQRLGALERSWRTPLPRGSDPSRLGPVPKPMVHAPSFADAATRPSGKLARTDATHVRRCLLVVEDNADIRECFGVLLEGEGFEAILAVNGADALARLDEMTTLPDFILLDLMMPVMDGFEFRAKQRADVRVAHIPVVVISADPRLDARHDVLAAYAFLRKPCDIDLLLAMVSGRVDGTSPAGARRR